MVSASPTPVTAPTSSEASPLQTTVGRIKSRLQMAEKGLEKGGTSKLGKQRVDVFVPLPTPVLVSTSPPSPVLLPVVVGPRTPPDTPT